MSLENHKLLFLFDLDDTLVEDIPGPDGKIVKWGKYCKAIDGALDVIKQIKALGHYVAVYSMGSKETRLERLATAGIDKDLFVDVYTSMNKSLYDWQELERTDFNAFRKLGIKIIVVGDSWVRDVSIGLGRADAVVFIKTEESMRKYAPESIDEYPVWAIPSVAELPKILPELLKDPYKGQDREKWKDYYKEAQERKQKMKAERYKKEYGLSSTSTWTKWTNEKWTQLTFGGVASGTAKFAASHAPKPLTIPSDPNLKIRELPTFPGGKRASVRWELYGFGEGLGPLPAMDKAVELFEALGFTLYERQPVYLDHRLVDRGYNLSVFFIVPIPDEKSEDYLANVLEEIKKSAAYREIYKRCGKGCYINSATKARVLLPMNKMDVLDPYQFPTPAVEPVAFFPSAHESYRVVPLFLRIPGPWCKASDATLATLRFAESLLPVSTQQPRLHLLYGGNEAGYGLRVYLAVPVNSDYFYDDLWNRNRKLFEGSAVYAFLKEHFRADILWDESRFVAGETYRPESHKMTPITGTTPRTEEVAVEVAKWNEQVSIVANDFTPEELRQELTKDGLIEGVDFMVDYEYGDCVLTVPLEDHEFFKDLLNGLRMLRKARVKEKQERQWVEIPASDFTYKELDEQLREYGYQYGKDYKLVFKDGKLTLLTPEALHAEFTCLLENWALLTPQHPDAAAEAKAEAKRTGFLGQLQHAFGQLTQFFQKKPDEQKWETLILPKETDRTALKKQLDERYRMVEGRDYILKQEGEIIKLSAPAIHIWAFKRITGLSDKKLYRYTENFMIGEKRLQELLNTSLKGVKTLVVATGRHHQNGSPLYSVWIPMEEWVSYTPKRQRV